MIENSNTEPEPQTPSLTHPIGAGDTPPFTSPAAISGIRPKVFSGLSNWLWARRFVAWLHSLVVADDHATGVQLDAYPTDQQVEAVLLAVARVEECEVSRLSQETCLLLSDDELKDGIAAAWLEDLVDLYEPGPSAPRLLVPGKLLWGPAVRIRLTQRGSGYLATLPADPASTLPNTSTTQRASRKEET